MARTDHPLPILLVPTRAQLNDLAPGDFALDAFGRMAEVVELTACREDVRGKLFVCYTTRVSDTSTCSMSMKEGELVRTVATSARYTSAQLDSIEREMRANGEDVRNPSIELAASRVFGGKEF